MEERNKIFTAFGLLIESDIELVELCSLEKEMLLDKNMDVKILYGEVPTAIKEPPLKNPWYEVKKGEFLLRVDDIAKYYVKNGETTIVEPSKDASEDDIRVFLLNTVLVQLLYQRGVFVLHGSAAVVNGKAVVIEGGSGVGKTSMALSLYDKGYKVLTDEVCAIKIVDNKVMVLPGIPQLNLWQDTMIKHGKDINNYKVIRNGINKFAFKIEDRFSYEAVELSSIVFLDKHNKNEVKYNEVKGAEKLSKLMKSRIRANCAEVEVVKEKTFMDCLAIANKAKIVELTFNESPYKVNELVDFLLEELKI